MTLLLRSAVHDPNHDALIQGVAAAFSILSFSALCFRLYSRRLTAHRMFTDDYLVIVAWIVALGQSAMFASGGPWSGSGHHIEYVTLKQLVRYQKGFYADAFLQNGSLTLSKLSVIIQLHRIFILPRFRLAMYVLGAIVISWGISTILAYAFICTPVRSNWDPTIPHHCGNQKALERAVPIPFIVTDFAILISPIPVLKGLQMSRWRKIGLSALFLTGILTCIVACIRYSALLNIDQTDPTWSSSSAQAWSIVETNITVVCACIIIIAPALKRIHEKHFASSLKKKLFGLGSSWSRRGQRWRYRSDTPKSSGRFLPSIHVNQPHLLSTADREMFEIATRKSNETATADHSAV